MAAPNHQVPRNYYAKFYFHNWIEPARLIGWCYQTRDQDLSTHQARIQAWAALQGLFHPRFNVAVRYPDGVFVAIDLDDVPFKDTMVRLRSQFQQSHATTSQARENGGQQMSQQASLGIAYTLENLASLATNEAYFVDRANFERYFPFV